MVAVFTRSAGRIGPGYMAALTGFAGPTALDDWLYVVVWKGASSDSVCSGTKLAEGNTAITAKLGVDFHGPNIGGLYVPIADGDAVELEAWLFSAAFATIEHVARISGFSWDPTSALWTLLDANGQVQAILDAVYHKFPQN